MTVAFVSHADCGFHDTGWGHPEHVGRLRAITRALREEPELFGALTHVEGRPATEEELGTVHDARYVALVRATARSGGGRLDADTPVSSGSWSAATAAVGCVLDAVRMTFDGTVARCFCAVRPPGHHAVRDRGMGFCLFGNVAIGAHRALSHHGAERVLIVDWDVHHGNGTQSLVEHEPAIRLVSMHQWPWYPGTGPAHDRGAANNVWNIPMPAGLAPHAYVDALKRGVDQATERWVPDVVLLSSGFDSLRGDPLGGFTLGLDEVTQLTRWLVDCAAGWCAGRLVSALEGGYNTAALGQACVAHLKQML